MLFSFGKIQAVMGCQHLADLFIPVTVDMICDDELRVLDSHQFHIVVGNFQHQPIIVTDAVSVYFL